LRFDALEQCLNQSYRVFHIVDLVVMAPKAQKKPVERPSGTQSIERTLRIFRALSSSSYLTGMEFSVLQELTGLSKGTLYRILRVLRREGFVEQHPDSHLYSLGMDFMALGSAAMNRFGIREIARPHLMRIAMKTSDTVYLSVRSGFEAVCIDREEGSFPIKVLTLAVGSRRPLGVGAGSMALLAWLPDAEIKDIIQHNARRLSINRLFSPSALLDLVKSSRKQGFAFNDGRILKSMCTIAVPVLGAQGKPLAALGVTAISDRMGSQRRKELFGIISLEASKLADELISRGAEQR
jgi:DNA-binding IclR family transcriptional regulator